jgi:tripartite-type tricarboxylate transporter receptor subunit TctC
LPLARSRHFDGCYVDAILRLFSLLEKLWMKLRHFAAAFLFACAATHAFADAWPSKPIRFVVAAPAGSSLDVIARTLGDKLTLALGQPIVIDNVPGAGGTIATANVARAAADGYTMLLSFNGPLAFAQFLTKLPYHPQKDFAPVILTSSQPNVLAVNAKLPVKNMKELIAYAKTHPGKLNYASVGNGSSSHLTAELFKTMAGISIVHIPYNGAPPAALSVAGGDTQVIFTIPTVIMPHVKSGKMKVLAVSSATRFPLLPDIPTVAESGLPTFESLAWNGVLVPAKTAPDIVRRLNREIDAALKTADVKNRLHTAGLEPVGGSPDVFKSIIASEATKSAQSWIEPVATKQAW